MRARITMIALSLLLATGPVLADDEEGDLQGSIELLYRNVSLDGESRKYDEDFDGLASGFRISSFSADWLQPGDGKLDYARFDFSGLGGDPYESSRVRVGRKDGFDLAIKYTKQDYIYNLFELVGNEDGATWDAERRIADIALRVFARDNVTLVFEFQDGRRSGSSLFMKDISRQLFRLETPLDVTHKRYTVGADFRFGDVDLVFRQTLRRYDNQFENRTEADLGVEAGSSTTLDHYEWIQNDSGGTDWTTLQLHASPGNRVDLTVGVFGTFLGDESLRSRVDVNFDGTNFLGMPMMVVDGFSNADLEGDTTLIDADVSVRILDNLDLHVQYRNLDRDLEGTADQDLNGTGTSSMVNVLNNYELQTLSAVLNFRAADKVALRAGYRTIDRELERNGFVGLRNLDYDSGGDDSVILGVTLKPVDWFRLNADLEDGEVDQPFNAMAPQEREHLRVRASFMPQDDMRLDLGYLDYQYTNRAPDLRDPMSLWDGMQEGTSLSASFWHRANENTDYMLRYAEQEVNSSVGVTFDTAGFFGTETGDSIFDNDNTQVSFAINHRFSDAWKANLSFWSAESDGNNILNGDVSGNVNTEMIDQQLDHGELGVTYSFDSGMYVGAAIRVIEYDDRNNLLDYDAEILTWRLGMRF